MSARERNSEEGASKGADKAQRAQRAEKAERNPGAEHSASDRVGELGRGLVRRAAKRLQWVARSAGPSRGASSEASTEAGDGEAGGEDAGAQAGAGAREGRGLEGRRRGAAYTGAVEAVFALLIATLGGWWVDERFGTAPIGIFAGVVLGFAAFVLRLVRMRSLLEPGGPGASEGGGPPRGDGD